MPHPCGTCNKSAATNSLVCVLCGLWHHLTVACMPWHTLDQIKVFKEVFSESSAWACGKCKVIMTRIGTRLGELEKKVDGVRKDVDEVEKKVDSAVKEREEMKKKTAELEAKITSNTNNVKAACMSEAEQRYNKRKNVVLYGVPESAAATAAERISHDKQELMKVLDTIGASEQIKQDGNRRIYRSGKVSSDAPRTLVVGLKSEDQRDELLDKSRILREDEEQPIRMKPDLTKMQRDQDKALRNEVDDLNKTKLTDERGPYHWKIAGPPGQLRKVKVPEADQPKRNRQRSRRQDTD